MKKLLILFFLIISIASYGQLTLINVGTSANDHTGDPLRTAFIKVNLGLTQTNTNTAAISLRAPITNASMLGLTKLTALKVGNTKPGSTVVQIDSITTSGGNIYFYSGGVILTAVPGTGSTSWGLISGALANQVDLQNALNAKGSGTLVAHDTTHLSARINLKGSGTLVAHDTTHLSARINLKANTSALAGYVPTSTTVNGHVLSSNVSVTASDVSLGNLTNESKATMFGSPTFTGIPAAPTAVAGTNTTQIATTAFVTGGLAGKANTSHTQAQSTITDLPDTLLNHYTKAQANALFGGSSFAWIDSANYYTKEFIITDPQFGAVSGDGNSDNEAIQLAIDAAYANVTDLNDFFPVGYVAKVVIPSGIWLIDAADTLRAHMEISIDNGAVFTCPVGHTGYIWVNPTKKTAGNNAETRKYGLTGTWIHGGIYSLETSPNAGVFKLNSLNTYNMVTINTLSNFIVTGGDTIIYYGAEGTGWNTSNIVKNVSFHQTLGYGAFVLYG